MIGHSNLDWATFSGLLTRHGITRLIDVRTHATSRWPQYNGDALQSALGAIYRHWPALGGHYAFSEAAVERTLKDLLNQSGAERVALMCSEGDFRRCHRHTMLAPILLRLGWRVLQIGGDGGLVEDFGPHPQLPLD